eukprot:scaffold24042_cov74-Skeletonema_dohrnii-CCMP3373.AAC.1
MYVHKYVLLGRIRDISRAQKGPEDSSLTNCKLLALFVMDCSNNHTHKAHQSNENATTTYAGIHRFRPSRARFKC